MAKAINKKKRKVFTMFTLRKFFHKDSKTTNHEATIEPRKWKVSGIGQAGGRITTTVMATSSKEAVRIVMGTDCYDARKYITNGNSGINWQSDFRGITSVVPEI